MNPCAECPIEDRLTYCCGMQPETGDAVKRRFPDGTEAYACPELRPSGRCGVYDERPGICREEFCSAYSALDVVDLLTNV